MRIGQKNGIWCFPPPLPLPALKKKMIMCKMASKSLHRRQGKREQELIITKHSVLCSTAVVSLPYHQPKESLQEHLQVLKKFTTMTFVFQKLEFLLQNNISIFWYSQKTVPKEEFCSTIVKTCHLRTIMCLFFKGDLQKQCLI